MGISTLCKSQGFGSAFFENNTVAVQSSNCKIAGTILEALRRTVDEVGVVAVLKRLSVLVALMDFMNIKGQIKVRRRPLEAAVEMVVWYEVAYSSGDEGRPQVQTSSGGRLEA